MKAHTNIGISLLIAADIFLYQRTRRVRIGQFQAAVLTVDVRLYVIAVGSTCSFRIVWSKKKNDPLSYTCVRLAQFARGNHRSE